ncbi:GNAT family N-acetyltransferase [Rhizobium leguminosarum]|uniref:Ribosomal protein S18 acetylase RimI-like enzyme n=1 Tax=Rhizobium leguminosarum TaxID=384 RepID=A0A7X0DQJ0_RHILE|nr:GNAT family N-acetyltransferase [Rhizobium leguminosarum]MBB6219386.1 ribosomal protein S18 acetylase RimI-like enzyme [Rhizobium leguminosarum]
MDLLGRYGADLMQLHQDWDRLRFISPGPRTPAMYSSYLRGQLGKPDVIVLAAEVDGVVAGYIYAGLEGPDYMALRGPAGVIHDIFVDKTRRRQGIGRALLGAGVEALSKLGATQVVLSTAHQNADGQRLFALMGFTPTMVEMTLQLSGAVKQT